MSQPMHPRAPATPATPVAAARIAASPSLDGWSSLSPIALPTLAPASGARHRRNAWPRLVTALIPRLRAARAA